jgi:hypothetical protein
MQEEGGNQECQRDHQRQWSPNGEGRMPELRHKGEFILAQKVKA